MIRKLLDHRRRVQRLRRQLRTKDEEEVEAQNLEAKSIVETMQLEEQLLPHPLDSASLDCLTLEPGTEKRQDIEATEQYGYGMTQGAAWSSPDMIGNDTLDGVFYNC